MTLDHLGKRIKKIGTCYPWSIPSKAILIGLVSYALVCSVALVFSLWHNRGPYTCIQAITWKHRLPRDTVCRTRKNTYFPAQFKPSEAMTPLEILS